MFWFPVIFLAILAFVWLISRSNIDSVLSAQRDHTVVILNRNTTMTEFCYHTKLTTPDIIQRLSVRNGIEDPGYDFDRNTQIIRFYEPPRTDGYAFEYRLVITELPHTTHLRVQMIAPAFPSRSMIPIIQNDFWCRKLDAVPAEYTKDAPVS